MRNYFFAPVYFPRGFADLVVQHGCSRMKVTFAIWTHLPRMIDRDNCAFTLNPNACENRAFDSMHYVDWAVAEICDREVLLQSQSTYVLQRLDCAFRLPVVDPSTGHGLPGGETEELFVEGPHSDADLETTTNHQVGKPLYVHVGFFHQLEYYPGESLLNAARHKWFDDLIGDLHYLRAILPLIPYICVANAFPSDFCILFKRCFHRLCILRHYPFNFSLTFSFQ
jgi:hypothetical protein